MRAKGVVEKEPGATGIEARLAGWGGPSRAPEPTVLRSRAARHQSRGEVDARGEGSRSVPSDALRVLDLQKWYRSGFWGQRRQAVAGLSFVVARGEVFALLGHNGAGKTTTMKAILGLVRLDHGSIEILGRDHRQPQARARVGYLPESPTFYEQLNALELLDFQGRLHGLAPQRRRARARDLLELVGLDSVGRLPLRKYSKGMLQRVGLAQALLPDPELLVLDEPMSGLDPLGRRQFRDLLLDLKRRGRTILLSSHIVPDVEVLADRVAILHEGRLHSVHQMTRLSGQRRFDVATERLPSGLVASPHGDAATGAPGAGAVPGRHCDQSGLATTGDRASGPQGHPVPVQLSAGTVKELQRLLQTCQDAGVEVLSVSTRRTDLEDLYLQAVSRTAATKWPPPSHQGET